MTNLIQRDQKTIWHPFIQHGIESEFVPVSSAKGAQLTLENGTTLIDAVSSWWVNLHGHAHPKISQAIYDQAQKLEQVIFAGFTHEPAVALAEKLLTAVQASGTNLTRCFYSDNGSTAVEVAMKMAYQYHQNNNDFRRTKFLAFTNSYHGDTLGSMALSARNSFHRHFVKLFPPVDFIAPDDLSALENILEKNHQEYAAVIIEPMIQAAGGMRVHSADFLKKLAAYCQSAKILLICDEVFTGFFRTGKCFAFEHAGIKPDFICLAKGLTAGFLPLAVTLTTEMIFDNFKDQTNDRTFIHGHSYTANPLACAAALASWELLQQTETQNTIKKISEQTQAWVKHLSLNANSLDARHLGTIGAIELNSNNSYLINYKIRSYAIENGVLLRPLGSVLYCVPPYCITSSELDKVYSVMESIVNNLGKFQ